MLEIAFETPDVFLFCLPPHTTHKLQPLDVGIFGPLQRAWSDRCHEIAWLTGEGLSKSDVVKEYMIIRNKVFIPALISRTFTRCGLSPLNPDIFTDKDFAPAKSTSTIAHMPASYPVVVSGGNKSATDQSSDNPATVECMGDRDLNSDWEQSDDEDNKMDEHATSSALDASSLLLASTASPEPPVALEELASKVREEEPQPLPLGARASLKRKLEVAHEELVRTRTDNQRLRYERNSAVAHAQLAQGHNGVLRTRLDAKEKRSQPKRTLNISSFKHVNSADAKKMFAAQQAERQAKQREQEEREAVRLAKLQGDRERRARLALLDDQTKFQGALSGKNKTELQDIASALHVPYDVDKTKKEELITAIKTHLEDFKDMLSKSPRFEGLYSTSGRGRRAPASDNAQAVPQSPSAQVTTTAPQCPLTPRRSHLPLSPHPSPSRWNSRAPPTPGPSRLPALMLTGEHAFSHSNPIPQSPNAHVPFTFSFPSTYPPSH